MEPNDELEGRLRQHHNDHANELRLPAMEFEHVIGTTAAPLGLPHGRSARRVAPWLAAATLVATVGTVGLLVSRDQPSRKITAAVSASPEAAAFYDELEAVRAAANGTPEQVGALRQTKIYGCMTAAGYTYDVPAPELSTQITYYRPGWEFRPSRDLAQQAGMGLWDETTNVAIAEFVAEGRRNQGSIGRQRSNRRSPHRH